MIIYNITTKLEWKIADDWIEWMKKNHIPTIMATGYFIKFQFVKLIDVDDLEGPTYAIQFFSTEKSHYDQYIASHSANLKSESFKKWGNNFISFRSLMEVIM